MFFKNFKLALHPSLYSAMHKALTRVLIHSEHSNYVVKHILKQNQKWGSKDRYFFAKFVYSSLRHLRRLGLSIGLVWEDKAFFTSLDPDSIDQLLVAWFVVNDHFLMIEPQDDINNKNLSWHCVLKNKDVINSFATNAVYKNIIQKWQAVTIRKEVYSISDSLDKVAYKELGEKWNSLLEQLDTRANVYLRVNTSKISVDNLLKKLKQENIEAQKKETDLVKHCIFLTRRQNISLSDCFKQALFEVQDINSQAVVPFLNLKSGQYIIDACAGAGGKSLHIADLLGSKGKILSLDIVKNKLTILHQRAKKSKFLKLINTKLLVADTPELLNEQADGVLLDVPCSGLGVLKRHPESKWRFTASNLLALHNTQLSLLNQYSNNVKTGGILVYATCSILPSENQTIIKQFLLKANKNFKHWKVLKSCILDPGQGDGFFICSLQKLN